MTFLEKVEFVSLVIGYFFSLLTISILNYFQEKTYNIHQYCDRNLFGD